jgi:hypothetical protein
MNLEKLKSLFTKNGCQKIYVKRLAPNDNSKNQVYLGGSFEVLNILPISKIITEPAGDWKKERFKAALNFSWIGEDGNLYPARQSQLILYPKYPEVRFSGFLNQCDNAPSELMTQRLANRLLFLGVTEDRTIIGYVISPSSDIAAEFEKHPHIQEEGVFKVIELAQTTNSRQKLLNELKRIYKLDWIPSKSLTPQGKIVPCTASQCGGYTLEAELGIRRNGRSEPDFLGWEVKNFHVNNLLRTSSSVITLMTPEPTGGLYKIQGKDDFIRQYGYGDLKGREDRINFGGVHKVGVKHKRTRLKLELVGFDKEHNKIRNTDGKIVLIDEKDREAASWNFASMIIHWNTKHNQACYVPSLSEKEPERKYKYGNNVILGIGTDFQLFLKEMQLGHIYYDPGIKMENASKKPEVKARSQFRIKSGYLSQLYKENEVVNTLSI